jgi:murein DD-endopeptidase MepM/ murein hydrolase activator NlpD
MPREGRVALSLNRRLVNRREFVFGSVGVLAGGLVLGGVSRSGRSERAAAVTIETAQAAPMAFLSADTVPQGGAFSVHLSTFDASSSTATFNGQTIDLLPDGEWLVGLFGAGQDAGDETEIDPGAYAVELDALDGSGAPFSVKLALTVTTTDFPVDAVSLPPSVSALLAPDVAAREAASLNALYAPVTPTRLWDGLMQWPVQGPITTNFGQARSYNGGPVSGHHSGVDIGVDFGTPVGAAAPGVVAFAGSLAERGNFIAVDHGLGVYTGYAHLSQIVALVGTRVSAGDVIGLVGTTGLSTGPHLHWEVAVHTINVDAMRWTWNLLP